MLNLVEIGCQSTIFIFWMSHLMAQIFFFHIITTLVQFNENTIWLHFQSPEKILTLFQPLQ